MVYCYKKQTRHFCVGYGFQFCFISFICFIHVQPFPVWIKFNSKKNLKVAVVLHEQDNNLSVAATLTNAESISLSYDFCDTY